MSLRCFFHRVMHGQVTTRGQSDSRISNKYVWMFFNRQQVAWMGYLQSMFQGISLQYFYTSMRVWSSLGLHHTQNISYCMYHQGSETYNCIPHNSKSLYKLNQNLISYQEPLFSSLFTELNYFRLFSHEWPLLHFHLPFSITDKDSPR